MTSTVKNASPRMIPGTRRIPLVGQGAALFRLTQNPLGLFRDHYRRFGALSGLTTFPDGGQGTLLAFGSGFNQEVLSNPGVFYNPNLTTLGDSSFTRLVSGLVTMNGERHRQQRRLIMPAFHRQAVAAYAGAMADYTTKMLEGWTQKDQINLMPDLRQLVLRIVSHSLFGLEAAAEDGKLGALIDRWTPMVNAPQYVLFPPLRRQLEQVSKQLEDELLALINRRRAGELGNDVLSMLIQAHDEDGTSLTDRELIGQLAVLFIAGHETTVNALAWVLILFAHYPALRLELVESLTSTLGENSPTVEQAYAFPQLDYFIKETMRLLPPLVYTLRMGNEPFELGGYALAKDSMVILSHYITHRLPEIYAEPETFRPQRWENLDVSPYEYLPFSAGARMCIGATFASLEMRIILAMLLSRVQVVPTGKVDYKIAGNILQPKGLVPCAIYPASQRREANPLSGTIAQLL
jgi:cytochrome P450